MRIAVLLVIGLAASFSMAEAQEPRIYAGGSLGAVTQTQPDDEPLGGTTWGWSAVFGVNLNPRLSVEFEPTFVGPYSREYSYRPSPSLVANVVASRRQTFLSTQLRIHLPVIEPVVGVSYVHAALEREATIGGQPYFADNDSENGVALVAGVDAAFRLSARVHFVPSFRMFIASSAEPDPFENPIRADTSTGAVSFRYGAGFRITF